MKVTIILLVLIPSSCVVAWPRFGLGRNLPALQQRSPKCRRAKAGWCPATYRDLTMGRSTRADMLRVFGKPKWSEMFEENGSNAEVWYHYEGKDIPGEIVVNVDKISQVILRLLLHPKDLSKEEAIKYFGDEFMITRYEFCAGFEEAESAPLYETPRGQFSYLEYRERGIAINFDNHGIVDNITYVSEPIGAPSSKCKRTDKSP
jgi:hypothetical protein